MAQSYLMDWEYQDASPFQSKTSLDSYDSKYLGKTGTQGGGMEPVSAGMMVGGQFLSNYLAARAQEEENRKKALMDAAQTQGQQEQNAMSNMGNWYARALLGG